jgi:hypothetical protein
MNKNTLFTCYTLLFLLLLDFLFFGFILWRIPNESPWNTNHFYNFIYEWKKIERKPKQRKRIFVVGSSIAYYSMDKTLLQKSLSKSLNEEVDVEYFSYAGKSPLYMYLFLEELWKLKPDLVVYPINFIDFRLHRAQVLQPEVLLANIPKDLLERDAISVGEAPQAKIIFPWQTLTKMWNLLTWEDRAEFFLASIFRFYAYKDIYAENISNIYNHRFGRNTRYHGYAGVQIPERVNSLGWTGKKFSFSLTNEIREKGIWIEVVPEILEVEPLKIQFQSDTFSETIMLYKSGWMKISLNQKHFGTVKATLSHTWSATTANSFLKDYHRDRMGVRLTQTFGLDLPAQNSQYNREERTEDLRYIGMSDSEYEEYFYFRLLADFHLRPGIRYLVELANSKKKLANEDFAPILHFYYLKLISEEFAAKKIPLLIINNPENPISLDWYKNSNWYNGYLAYLSSLNNAFVGFIDLKENLPMQDFSDYHHFTYPGMVKMNHIYTQEIVKFSALKNEQK